jgi:hypothetical protein
MDAFRQLQALSLLVLALFIAPGALRPYARRLRVAALVLYVAGAVAILAGWQLGGG